VDAQKKTVGPLLFGAKAQELIAKIAQAKRTQPPSSIEDERAMLGLARLLVDNRSKVHASVPRRKMTNPYTHEVEDCDLIGRFLDGLQEHFKEVSQFLSVTPTLSEELL